MTNSLIYTYLYYFKKDRRNISTVVLDSDVKKEILDDVENFIDSKQFYTGNYHQAIPFLFSFILSLMYLSFEFCLCIFYYY